MKKAFVGMAIGSAAMLQVCSVGAVEQPEVVNDGMVIDYGFSLEAEPGGTSFAADYELEVAADQTQKMSINVAAAQGEEKYDVKLDDIFIVDKENLYLNVSEGVEALKQNVGDSGYQLFLNMVGITEDWVALPFPEFDKLGLQFAMTPGALPQFSDELVTDFQPVLAAFMPEVKDGVTTFTIDNDKLLQAAQAADTFIAANSEELSQIILENPAMGNPLENLNINAAFEKYINAVAAGMAEATGMPEKEAVDQVNAIVDSFTQGIIESYSSSITANGQPLTPEMLENPAVEETVKELLADQNILASLSYDENSAEVIYRTDSDSYVIDAAIQEDNTIKLEIGDGETVYAIGNLESTETGLKASFTDAEGNSELATLTLDISEDGFALSGDSAGQSFKLTGYMRIETPAAPITIDIPTASDGLEVAKNIGMLLFTPLSDSAATP